MAATGRNNYNRNKVVFTRVPLYFMFNSKHMCKEHYNHKMREIKLLNCCKQWMESQRTELAKNVAQQKISNLCKGNLHVLFVNVSCARRFLHYNLNKKVNINCELFSSHFRIQYLFNSLIRSDYPTTAVKVNCQFCMKFKIFKALQSFLLYLQHFFVDIYDFLTPCRD